MKRQSERTHDNIGVSVEVLRDRVHDEVSPELKRALVIRGGKGVVNNDQGAKLVGNS